MRVLFLACRWPPSHVSSHDGESALAFPARLVRAPVLSDEGPTLTASFSFYTSPALSPNTATLGVRASTYEFEGDTHTPSITRFRKVSVGICFQGREYIVEEYRAYTQELMRSAHNKIQSRKAEGTEPQSLAFGVWGCN